jgi:hypothetical protein
MSDDKEARIVKGKDGQLRLENFYTPLAEAKKEIRRRWNDKELKKKMEKFLRDTPSILEDSPKAYLARHLNTPDKEFFRFLKLAEKLNLVPICPEMLSDKFSAKNSDKYYLGKLFFHNGNGKNGGDKISTLRIINFNKAEGKKLSSIKTTWGENLADFHHTILKAATPNFEINNPDFSKWFAGKCRNLNDMYKYFLSFFMCHAVLLESYDVNEEKSFIEKFVLPQFNFLSKKFGVKPLIVRLLPNKTGHDRIWCCHPESVKKLLTMIAVI